MIKKIFIRGLFTLAPIVITIAVIVWLFNFIESFFATVVTEVLGPQYYFKGSGVLFFLVLIFIVGILINHWIVQKLYGWFEKLLHKMPLVKTLYQSITDLMSFFKKEGDIVKKGSVVMVDIQGFRALGLVSRRTFKDLPKGIGKEDEEVIVFIPLSYQIGGITIVVKKSQISPIDMAVDAGLRFAATAGMSGCQKNSQSEESSSS